MRNQVIILHLIILLTRVTSNKEHKKIVMANVAHAIIAHVENWNYSSNCSCVPYYQCSEETGGVITDGDGLLDFRVLADKACTGYFDVCCNVTIEPKSQATRESQAIHVGNSADEGCGYFRKTTAVILARTTFNSWAYKCGASIIHPQVAITAAHCVIGDEEWQLHVQVGGASITNDSNVDAVRVKKVVPHPKYNNGTLRNDIALLFLLTVDDDGGECVNCMNFSTICLPPQSARPLTARRCTVATRLRIIEVPLVEHAQCEQLLRRTRLGRYFQLHASFLCAGGESFQDACDGDGGAPLICAVPDQPGRFHQVGIVSWGIGCGEQYTPGIYVNVAIFRNWIDEVIQREIEENGSGFSKRINLYRY